MWELCYHYGILWVLCICRIYNALWALRFVDYGLLVVYWVVKSNPELSCYHGSFISEVRTKYYLHSRADYLTLVKSTNLIKIHKYSSNSANNHGLFSDCKQPQSEAVSNHRRLGIVRRSTQHVTLLRTSQACWLHPPSIALILPKFLSWSDCLCCRR